MASRNDEKKIQARCSFCNKSEDQVRKLIAGPNAFICDQCVDICAEIIDEEFVGSPAADGIQLLKPMEIKEFLDEYVIGQEQAKKVLSVAVYNHYKRILSNDRRNDVELQKSNVIMVGPTGSGKTLLAQTLAKMLNVPFAIADATALTEAGYVGEDVENILLKLIQAADYDIERAETGIIYVDEIDKITRKGENVSNILFICGGAFDGLEKIIESRTGHKSMGFGAEIRKTEEEKDMGELLRQVLPQDFVKFGLIPEFIGRVPVCVTLDPLDEHALTQILTEPKNALVKQYQKLFDMDAVKLTFTPEAIQAIAKKAIERKTGARGLRSIIENAMMDLMYTIPSDLSAIECQITEDVIVKGEAPLIIYGDRGPVRKGSAKKLPKKNGGEIA